MKKTKKKPPRGTKKTTFHLTKKMWWEDIKIERHILSRTPNARWSKKTLLEYINVLHAFVNIQSGELLFKVK